ncbi:DegT/DnrJ/EryC1/StrS aminotransferase family protein [Alteribacillus sp. YIM 98480]|uniref:DegT/DnrJ/EryC1/StrS family aminotransferase n=1 Tax=Alteribacillus sp. YIM 98480 TaxID=2606599 RepID=UPI00131C18CF|nr:aminotransferase class I/II-fold pyridoxal phosphate-dependent enzyme [Alteribacillus sp. YIM 98480]
MIYLSPPHMSGNEKRLVMEAFDSNWIAPLGPQVKAFEKEMAEYVNTKGALALNSGTAAIHLALKLLNVGRGDTVFCSSLTFVASANPILYLGAEPVFIDSEPSSWNMSANALKRAFINATKSGNMPKAVIIVNIYGQSADMDSLLSICNYYNVPVIEDAAESLGATYKGKVSGTFGEFGVYSFNGNKIITTSGGGMLVSNDLDALERARYMATQARDPALHYQHSKIGYNYRLSNILAAIGRAQLKVLMERITSRRQIFNKYYTELHNIKGIKFMPEAAYGRSTRWLTALTIDENHSGVTSTEIVEFLLSQNVEARPVWKPLHLQPLFKNCAYYSHSNENVSEKLFTKGVCLPSGSSLLKEEQERVIKCFLNALGI